MTNEEKQALTGLCKIEIKRWKVASEGNTNMRYMVELMEVALATLTAQPVVTGEHLDLIAAHREVADLKDQLAKSEAKFQNMLEAEHRLSDAYIRIREIVGTINLPEGADVWQATEAAAAKMVAMTAQPVKLPDVCGYEHPEKEAPFYTLNKDEVVAAIREAGYEVAD